MPLSHDELLRRMIYRDTKQRCYGVIHASNGELDAKARFVFKINVRVSKRVQDLLRNLHRLLAERGATRGGVRSTEGCSRIIVDLSQTYSIDPYLTSPHLPPSQVPSPLASPAACVVAQPGRKTLGASASADRPSVTMGEVGRIVRRLSSREGLGGCSTSDHTSLSHSSPSSNATPGLIWSASGKKASSGSVADARSMFGGLDEDGVRVC